MAKKVLYLKLQPKSLWTARRLAELSAEIDRLRKKVRVAEAAASKSPTRGRKRPSRHVSQADKQGCKAGAAERNKMTSSAH